MSRRTDLGLVFKLALSRPLKRGIAREATHKAYKERALSLRLPTGLGVDKADDVADSSARGVEVSAGAWVVPFFNDRQDLDTDSRHTTLSEHVHFTSSSRRLAEAQKVAREDSVGQGSRRLHGGWRRRTMQAGSTTARDEDELFKCAQIRVDDFAELWSPREEIKGYDKVSRRETNRLNLRTVEELGGSGFGSWTRNKEGVVSGRKKRRHTFRDVKVRGF